MRVTDVVQSDSPPRAAARSHPPPPPPPRTHTGFCLRTASIAPSSRLGCPATNSRLPNSRARTRARCTAGGTLSPSPVRVKGVASETSVLARPPPSSIRTVQYGRPPAPSRGEKRDVFRGKVVIHSAPPPPPQFSRRFTWTRIAVIAASASTRRPGS
ncbi:hypothetical protein HETIRDRAFT_454243 [Heterobasidion irregulare TC 32-1]|uniref:Uncharacterized protein n=1 Tax=Heterobasidion irregulare (strain TC 32-1) TaxID=747525 RepID=W4JZD4_HETIT|nr:uncharacterized protein HETIRDRAFT_454243 [Heterobasidion irregulare TC 32-1]ETW78231.1 hypothetical protein HETIRDRAFT_454243 [Heterobasidion irregulare TC 32-1]